MKILDRYEASRVWGQYWLEMKLEWFKVEVLQDYSEEDSCPSLQAGLAGDRQASLKLLKADTRRWAERLEQKRHQDILMRRVRIIERPYTPYTEWELECYKRNNIPGGEQVLIVERPHAEGLSVPSGDLMMFDNKRVVVCIYDGTNRVERQAIYDEDDDISGFLQLKANLLTLARPLE